MEYVYHYTSIETLAIILNDKTIRFNSLKNVDDMEEAETNDLEEFGQYCLVSCWTKSQEESIPLWNLYTPNMKGVRICMPNDLFDYSFNPNEKYKKSKAIKPLFDISEEPFPYPEYFEVQYTDELELIKPQILSTDTAQELRFEGDKLGRYKSSIWQFQQEYRFRLLLAPIDTHKTIFVNSLQKFSKLWLMQSETNKIKPKEVLDFKIKKESIEKMHILLGPRTNNSERYIVQALAEKYGVDKKNIQKSSLRIR